MPEISPNFTPRGWQEDAVPVIMKKWLSGQKVALVNACPGAGKTFFGCFSYFACLNSFPIRKVLVVSPLESTKDGWADACVDVLDLALDRDFTASSTYNPFAFGYIGISTTYAGMVANIDNLRHLVDETTLVILDEVHHLSEPRTRKDFEGKEYDDKTGAWSKCMNLIEQRCGLVLALSGTPFRGDGRLVPFLPYELINEYEEDVVVKRKKLLYNDTKATRTYKPIADFNYTYTQSVADGVNCPTKFKFVDSSIAYNDQNGGGKGMLSTETRNTKLSKLLRGAYESEDYVRLCLQEAATTLQEHRDEYPNDTKRPACLVVCKDVNHMEKYRPLIRECFGVNPVEVHSKKKGSAEAIKAFKDSDDLVMSSVKMVSEGTDIPRLTVIVYLTNDGTFTAFVQINGRDIRSVDGFCQEVVTILPDTWINRDYADMFQNDASPSITTSEVLDRDPIEREESDSWFDLVDIELFEDISEFFKPIPVSPKIIGKTVEKKKSRRFYLRNDIKKAVARCVRLSGNNNSLYKVLHSSSNKAVGNYFMRIDDEKLRINKEKASMLRNDNMTIPQLQYKLEYLKKHEQSLKSR